MRFCSVVNMTRATRRFWPPSQAMARSMRASSFFACSGLRTVSSVSGSSMPTRSTRRPFFFKPRSAESKPRVAMMARLDGEPGTLGNTISQPHQLNRLGDIRNGFPLSWRLPLRFKVRGGTGKWILRQIAYKYVPQELLKRPKMGFGVPMDKWLRGPLKEWAVDLLSASRLNRVGLLDPLPIAEKWAEHQAGARNWQHLLWHVLMYEAWNATYRPSHSSSLATATSLDRAIAATGEAAQATSSKGRACECRTRERDWRRPPRRWAR